jgi:hypothetical protein
MKKNFIALMMLLFGFLASQAQPTSVIRGTIRDAETKERLIGATVLIANENKGAVTDDQGRFIIKNVSIGRKEVRISYVGYQGKNLSNLQLTSGKELVIDVELELSIAGAVQIEGANRGAVLNEMATVSARAFDVTETDKYAGSRGDPARMASNFAGVQGADDSRNDIVVRGNSPQSVLWRMEGVDLPNPNHFAIAGTAGGPVSIINNKFLANSDFYTGAFPAEFGNTVAGVFDLRMRNGNDQKHEGTAQFGFLGTELMFEGPLAKKGKTSNTSYMIGYRYSTLSLFSKLGIDIGTNAVPRYQDAFFKTHTKLKKGGTLSFFGIGGSSGVDILISDQIKPERNIYGDNNRDQYFYTKMGIVGTSYQKSINKNTYLKATLAQSTEIQQAHHDLVFRHVGADSLFVNDSLPPILNYWFRQAKTSLAACVNHRFNSHHVVRVGILLDRYSWLYQDSARIIDESQPNYFQWVNRWDANQSGYQIQPYVQWKWMPTQKLSINIGMHAQVFTLTKSSSWVQPRLGLRYQVKPNQAFTFGGGLHTQTQPTYIYFYGNKEGADGKPTLYNKGLGFTYAAHGVAGYERTIGKVAQFKTEVYYQYLWNVPVEIKKSSFSLVNTGTGFSRFFPDSLQNTGTAFNYGMEFTLERFFVKGYYFLSTVSLFQSKYYGSDGILRNTDFNGQYAWNILFSKEFKIKKNQFFDVGGKVTQLGGRWYGPADTTLSNQAKEFVVSDSLRNTLRFNNYFRLDLKLNYKINRDHVTHEFAIDLVNLLNTKNVLKLTYAPGDPTAINNVRPEYQLGRLPLFYYKLQF